MHASSTPPLADSCDTQEQNGPQSIWELFVFFSLLALQGFGGMIAFVEKGLVQQKKWLTREEFLGDWAVARTMPGPPAINMSIMIGARYFGWRGAIASFVGVFTLPSILILALAILYDQFNHLPAVAAALRGMGAVAAGLVIATGIKLVGSLGSNVMGLRVCAVLVVITFVLAGLMGVRVAYILFSLGALACVYAYICLSRKESSR